MKSVLRVVASILLNIILIGTFVGVMFICFSCSSPEVDPIPVPVSDYNKEIIGKWETIYSTNVKDQVQFEYKANKSVNIYIKVNNEYILIPSESTYSIYDNKILHTTWKLENSNIITLNDETFWHITITGKIMYLSVNKVSMDGDSYVVSLTMKKLN